eukprot:ctg_3648.g606
MALDGWRAARRYVCNTFCDGRRQDAIDLFLGQVRLTPSGIVRQLAVRDRRDRRLGLLVVFCLLACSLTLWGLMHRHIALMAAGVAPASWPIAWRVTVAAPWWTLPASPRCMKTTAGTMPQTITLLLEIRIPIFKRSLRSDCPLSPLHLSAGTASTPAARRDPPWPCCTRCAIRHTAGTACCASTDTPKMPAPHRPPWCSSVSGTLRRQVRHRNDRSASADRDDRGRHVTESGGPSPPLPSMPLDALEPARSFPIEEALSLPPLCFPISHSDVHFAGTGRAGVSRARSSAQRARADDRRGGVTPGAGSLCVHVAHPAGHSGGCGTAGGGGVARAGVVRARAAVDAPGQHVLSVLGRGCVRDELSGLFGCAQRHPQELSPRGDGGSAAVDRASGRQRRSAPSATAAAGGILPRWQRDRQVSGRVGSARSTTRRRGGRRLLRAVRCGDQPAGVGLGTVESIRVQSALRAQHTAQDRRSACGAGRHRTATLRPVPGVGAIAAAGGERLGRSVLRHQRLPHRRAAAQRAGAAGVHATRWPLRFSGTVDAGRPTAVGVRLVRLVVPDRVATLAERRCRGAERTGGNICGMKCNLYSSVKKASSASRSLRAELDPCPGSAGGGISIAFIYEIGHVLFVPRTARDAEVACSIHAGGSSCAETQRDAFVAQW